MQTEAEVLEVSARNLYRMWAKAERASEALQHTLERTIELLAERDYERAALLAQQMGIEVPSILNLVRAK